MIMVLYRLFSEQTWILFALLFIIPPLLSTRLPWDRFFSDIHEMNIHVSSVLNACLSFTLIMVFVLFFLILPSGFGGNILIKLLLYGGFFILPLNQFTGWLVWAIGDKGKNRKNTTALFLKIFHAFVLVISILLFICGNYMLFVEPYWIEVSRIVIESENLNTLAEPLSILHLTDTHFEKDYPALRNTIMAEVSQVLQREQPDIIFLTGDYCNTIELETILPFFQSLSASGGVFAVSGNFAAPDRALFEKCPRITLLKNSWQEVSVKGQNLVIMGIDYFNQKKLSELFADVPKESFTILLSHTPDFVIEAAARGIDFMVSGHTHGGQVCLPFYGAVITLSKLGPAYASGYFQEDKTKLYISRGLGCEAGDIPKIRFLCRPELPLYVLKTPGQVE